VEAAFDELKDMQNSYGRRLAEQIELHLTVIITIYG
jgi:hypothetical protein